MFDDLVPTLFDLNHITSPEAIRFTSLELQYMLLSAGGKLRHREVVGLIELELPEDQLVPYDITLPLFPGSHKTQEAKGYILTRHQCMQCLGGTTGAVGRTMRGAIIKYIAALEGRVAELHFERTRKVVQHTLESSVKLQPFNDLLALTRNAVHIRNTSRKKMNKTQKADALDWQIAQMEAYLPAVEEAFKAIFTVADTGVRRAFDETPLSDAPTAANTLQTDATPAEA